MEPENNIEEQVVIKRPFILSLLCIVFFVHSAILAFLFLLGIFFNSWLTEVINNYIEVKTYSGSSIFFYTGIGFLLYAASFTGTWFLWQMKKKGLLVLSVSILFILLFTFFIGAGSLVNSIIYIVLLLFLSLFYGKLI
jgi:hypothetical protein